MNEYAGFKIGDRVVRARQGASALGPKPGEVGTIASFEKNENEETEHGEYAVRVDFDKRGPFGCWATTLVKISKAFEEKFPTFDEMQRAVQDFLAINEPSKTTVMSDTLIINTERDESGACTCCYGYPDCVIGCEANMRRHAAKPTSPEPVPF